MVLAASAVGPGAYDVLKPTPAPDSPVVAVPLSVNTHASDRQSDTSDGTSVADVSTTSTPTLLEISSADSTASFIVDEVRAPGLRRVSTVVVERSSRAGPS